MIRVLAVFGHRPEKIARILPYSGLEYKVIERVNYARDVPFIIKLLGSLPAKIWFRYFPTARMVSRKQIREFNPDIVITHGGAQAYPLMMETKRAGKKFVMRLGGHVYDEYRENLKYPLVMRQSMTTIYGTHYWFMFENLKHADHIIVVAKDMKNRLVAEGRYNPDKISVVPVPINTEKFYKLGDLKIPHKDKVVLTIINLNFMPKVRAILDFLPAIQDVIRKNPDVRYKLIAPGRYAFNLHKVFGDNLPQNIELTGFVENVAKEYHQADILAYFSYLDSVPNIVLEAWASGLPVVANRCAWSEELIQHGETGLLANTAEEAEKHISTLLGDSTMANKLANNGFRYLVTHHTEEIAGKRLGEVLRSIV